MVLWNYGYSYRVIGFRFIRELRDYGVNILIFYEEIEVKRNCYFFIWFELRGFIVGGCVSFF